MPLFDDCARTWPTGRVGQWQRTRKPGALNADCGIGDHSGDVACSGVAVERSSRYFGERFCFRPGWIGQDRRIRRIRRLLSTSSSDCSFWVYAASLGSRRSSPRVGWMSSCLSAKPTRPMVRFPALVPVDVFDTWRSESPETRRLTLIVSCARQNICA